MSSIPQSREEYKEEIKTLTAKLARSEEYNIALETVVRLQKEDLEKVKEETVNLKKQLKMWKDGRETDRLFPD